MAGFTTTGVVIFYTVPWIRPIIATSEKDEYDTIPQFFRKPIYISHLATHYYVQVYLCWLFQTKKKERLTFQLHAQLYSITKYANSNTTPSLL